MKTVIAGVLVALSVAVGVQSQDERPVPKDSERVYVSGCTKGYVFTAGLPASDRGSSLVPLGTRLRMAGPKTLMDEIKAREGARVELTGLVKKGQYSSGGIRLGGGRVTIGQGGGPGGGFPASGSQLVIDVEGWRSVVGECPQ
jgi:hypothetical protein